MKTPFEGQQVVLVQPPSVHSGFKALKWQKANLFFLPGEYFKSL